MCSGRRGLSPAVPGEVDQAVVRVQQAVHQRLQLLQWNLTVGQHTRVVPLRPADGGASLRRVAQTGGAGGRTTRHTLSDGQRDVNIRRRMARAARPGRTDSEGKNAAMEVRVTPLVP